MKTLLLTSILSLLLPARAPAAEASAAPAPRVALLDALVLPPTLEKTNLRSKVEQGVADFARVHGWEPVIIVNECHDLGCAGAVAGAAKTLYVLILAGRYAATDTYATDLGVSLWRDGRIIASRSESDEEGEHNRSGSRGLILHCGPPDGACTPQLLESKLEQYAGKVLADEGAAIRARAAAAAPQAPPPVSPLAPPMPVAPEEGRGGRALGWSLVGAGAILGGLAVGFWALDSSKVHCASVPGDSESCRFQRNTGTAAAVAGVAGGAIAAAGVVLLVVDRGQSRLALGVHPSSVTLQGRF